MNMEHWNLLKLFYKKEWGRRKNNGGIEPKQGIIDVYMEMSQ
jgi:hypothetical protein